MAAIAVTSAATPGHFTVTETALTASDTLTFVYGSGQLLKLRNPSAGILTITVKGTAPVSPPVAGTGVTFDTSAGKVITVGIGATIAVNLDKISNYLAGTATAVAVTGGAGGFASIIS